MLDQSFVVSERRMKTMWRPLIESRRHLWYSDGRLKVSIFWPSLFSCYHGGWRTFDCRERICFLFYLALALPEAL